MSQTGHRPLEESETFRVIKSAIRHPLRSVEGSQVVVGLRASDETIQKSETITSWRREPQFSALRAVVAAQGDDSGGMAATSAKYLSDPFAGALPYAKAADVIAAGVRAL
ncbi:type I polyketide synthase [Teratosphaeria destructans]|uniref:Type I polyketide synthase n=1 Tax=Teratosphaeria destructans TaxID=418781 RepID=A0A9W7SK81_9PEZI|nr:type I polyketide synthase [Teratosphaeria destructans]